MSEATILYMQPSGSHYQLTGVGSADGNTNTITLSNPTDDDLFVIFEVMHSGTTTNNLISLADGGNAFLGGVWLASTNDTLVILARGTHWVQVGGKDN